MLEHDSVLLQIAQTSAHSSAVSRCNCVCKGVRGCSSLLLLLLLLSHFSCVRIRVSPWTAACKAPLSIGFSRQEFWSGLPLPFPGDLPNPGFKPRSPTLQPDSLPAEPQGKPPGPSTLLQMAMFHSFLRSNDIPASFSLSMGSCFLIT